MNMSLADQLAEFIDDRERLTDDIRPPNSYLSKQSAHDNISNWAINNADEILARLRLVDAIVKGTQYTHHKRGGNYTKIAEGVLQTSEPINDNTLLVSYLSSDGKFWFRPINEFEDGRFQRIVK